jgi:hypothetical protein
MRTPRPMLRLLIIAVPASLLAVAVLGAVGAAANPFAIARPLSALLASARSASARQAHARLARARPAAARMRPAEIAAAAAIPAPLVRDQGPPVKFGLPAPPMTASMRAANAARQAAARRALRLAARGMGPDATCRRHVCSDVQPAARVLAGTQKPQVRDYWCGPATVSEMLAQLGKHLSQSAAARQLGTTTSGTDWSNGSGYPVPNVLNQNQNRNDYVAVALPWSPTVWQVRKYERDLVTDINYHGGVPLAGNAYEVPGGPHLAGHPLDQTIMHWFDIRGYADHGAITDYEDSVHDAASIGWALNVPAYSSMRSAAIVEILGARGYDW